MIKKFKSISGISLQAATAGEKVKVAFIINCKDETISDESKFFLAREILDDIVYPEILLRNQDNTLPSNFRLEKAHILMFDNEYRNKILLNEEVGFFANAILTNDISDERNLIEANDVKEILGLYPYENISTDAAHILLLRLGPKWYLSLNLVYNKKNAQLKVENARDYLNTAKYNLSNQIWTPFVDLLFTATELAIRSILSLIHLWEFTNEHNYDITVTRLKQSVENGNVPDIFLDHFVEMKKLSDKGKGIVGTTNDKFKLDLDKGMILFKRTEEIINYATKMTSFQKLEKGTIINFGKPKLT